MSIVLGKPQRLNAAIDGTGWKIVEITVLSQHSHKWSGRLRLEVGKPPRKEDHPWDAILKDGIWHVRGQGAILQNGNRINSALTLPFSLIKSVNDGIRERVIHWIKASKGKIVSNGAHTAPQETPLPPTRPVTRELPIHKVPAVVQNAAAPPAVASIKIDNGDLRKSYEIIEVQVSEIEPFKGQPREEFTVEDHKEMRGSLKQEGQKQIIVVTPIKGIPGKRWGLVDGERRYRGAVDAGTKTLLAMVRMYTNDNERFWDSFTMNWNRRGHTTYESARAIGKAIAGGKSIKEICVATGRSNCWVYQHHQLYEKLDPELLECLRISVPTAERMPVCIANRLARIPDKEKQKGIWEVARKEKTRGLMKIKADQLTEPLLADLPKRGRVRKPSDNARRILRIVRTAESDTVFLSRSNEADLKAFVAALPGMSTKESFIVGLRRVSKVWATLADKLSKTS